MFGFTDLEERLLGPDGAAELRTQVAALQALRDDVAARIAAGLPAQEYDTAQLLLAALNAGERILLDTTHLKGAKL